MGGELANEGRVEICFDNQFGTVCDDGWGNSDAAVVCAQLGFSREGKNDATSIHRSLQIILITTLQSCITGQ